MPEALATRGCKIQVCGGDTTVSGGGDDVWTHHHLMLMLREAEAYGGGGGKLPFLCRGAIFMACHGLAVGHR